MTFVATMVFSVLTAAGTATGGAMEFVELRAIDLAHRSDLQITVDREAGQYLGHPSTVLLEDGRTLLCVYPKGHGKGAIVYKRSTDGGRTWSERLPTPASWATSRETPTLYRLTDLTGKKRLVLFSGLYPIRMALSEDDGARWTELKPIGDFGGIVAMSSVVPLEGGRYAAFFHDDGRFLQPENPSRGLFTIYQTRSMDGGLTWGPPIKVVSTRSVHLCEPGVVRSPDGRELAMLLRENRRVRNSHVMFSRDEGDTWTRPRELPLSLTGDRHTATYLPDGRLFISFRDMAAGSPTHGDWVAWVGTYEDIRHGRDGQYRIRLMKNYRGTDCAYPGVALTPDGTIVTTTYGHWVPEEPPFIVCVRLKVREIDRLGAKAPAWRPRGADEVVVP